MRRRRPPTGRVSCLIGFCFEAARSRDYELSLMLRVIRRPADPEGAQPTLQP